jgi:hypothetical protein
MEIKGASLEVWKNWLEEELTPPYSNVVENNDEVKYVMEAFLELIKKVEE